MKYENSVKLTAVTNRQIVLHNLQEISELCFSYFTVGKIVCIGYYEQIMIVRHCNVSKSHPKPQARFNSFSQFN